MKTREELYAEEIIKTFVPKDKQDKIVEHTTFKLEDYSPEVIEATVARAKKNGVI